MGNLTSHPFVSDDVDWNAYVAAEWRSLRARELDRLGGANAAGAAGPPPPSALPAPHYTQHKHAVCLAGLTRPALAAGQSFSRKLDYLGVRACMGFSVVCHAPMQPVAAGCGVLMLVCHAAPCTHRPMCWNKQQKFRACLGQCARPTLTYPPLRLRSGGSKGSLALGSHAKQGCMVQGSMRAHANT